MAHIAHRFEACHVKHFGRCLNTLIATLLCSLALSPTQAQEPSWLSSIGVRARVGGERVLGAEQPEAFHEYDVVAGIRLPWERYHWSGWGVGTRLLASAGVLQGGKSNALVVSLIPVLAI